MMASTRKADRPGPLPRGEAHSRQKGKRSRRVISATERWVLISRKVYGRAQARGFVGGDPLEDLSDAIHQVDEEYVTDVKGLLSLTDPTELVEQFRNLFAGYGLGKGSLDKLLEMNRDALEKLAATNRALLHEATDRAARRASLLRNAAEDARQNLQNLVENAGPAEGRYHRLGQPTSPFRHLLSGLNALAEAAADFAGNGAADEGEEAAASQAWEEIHSVVVKAYGGMSPDELAEAPTSALKGLSPAVADELESAFGMVSIRDMADSQLVERAAGIVTLANEEGVDPGSAKASGGGSSFRELADGPVSRLQGVTPGKARVLRDSLRIRTIRDLAENRFFRVARAIVTLADLES